MRHECYFCHIKSAENLINKFKPDQETANSFLLDMQHLVIQHWNHSNPHLAASVHRLLKSKMNIRDLYANEKEEANRSILNCYTHWENLVNANDNPLHMAAKLAVIGNIIDYGAHSVPDDLSSEISSLVNKEFAIDDSGKLFEEIRKAKSILYLGDNTGEIVFDRLFIETMNHPNVTFAVKDAPVLNDATLYDAQKVGITDLCRVVSNGYDAPSTLPDKCSDEFLEIYRHADLIISKGQGNFEGLMEEKDSRLFFMLMAKCNPIAELLHVRKNDLVITQNKQGFV